MASVSAYQNNDYAPISQFQPYRLPVNDIYKALAAQNQFWEQGAARVKSVYDNALDLQLLTDDNKTRRDDFIKEAEQQLTKLSTMSVSDPEVQRKGFAIFKPLLSDEDVVGEDYVVRSLNREESLGESFRTKDNGKGYNPMSVENIKFEKGLLRSSLNNKSGWKSLYGVSSKYTPYADTAKELGEITKLVKEQEIKTAEIKGDAWYLYTLQKKGVSKERLLETIQSIGSPQLKAQFGVEARNTFYKKLISDPQGIDQYFQGTANAFYEKKISEFEAKKAELDNEAYFTKNDEKKEALKTASDTLQKQIDKLRNEDKPKYLSQFQGLADMNRLSASLSNVEQLWTASSIDSLADKMAYESVVQEIKPNTAKIAQENIITAREGLKLGWAKLAEDARQANMLDSREKLKMELSFKMGGEGEGGDVLKGFDGSSGRDVNFTDPNLPAESMQATVKATLQHLEDKDEPLREAAISNIISPNAWAAIQSNVDKNSSLGEVLLPHELTQAAQFVKAFNDHYKGKTLTTQSGKDKHIMQFLGNTTEDAVKSQLEKMPIREFKLMMGNLISNDPDFSTKVMSSIGSKNKQAGINFRSTYDQVMTDNLNLSTQITQTIKGSIGPYAKYFDSKGNYLSEDSLNKAYERYVNDPANKAVEPAVSITSSGYQYGNHLLQKQPLGIQTREQFKENVLNLASPKLYRLFAENNVSGRTFTLKSDQAKTAVVQRLGTIAAELTGTDANPDMADLYDYLKENSSKISGYTIKRASATNPLPSIQFQMEGDGDKNDKVRQINNTSFKITDIPSEYFQSTNRSTNYRYRGAYIYHGSVKSPDGKLNSGEVSIINESTTAARVMPHFQIKDVFILTKDKNKPERLSEQDIRTAFVAKTGISIEQAMETSPDMVNTFISGMLLNIELNNEKILEEQKKK